MKRPDFLSVAVPGVQKLRPYEPGKPIAELQREFGIDDIIKLASNENPLGPSPKALAAAQAELAGLALYPDGNGFALKRALADKHRIDTSCITLGSGSDHILELIARAFLAPGRSAVMSQYAFAIYAIVSQAAGAELRVAPAKDFGHDLEAVGALVSADTRVVFLANPNNPTGTWFDQDALAGLLATAPPDVLVVVDEAYFEYVDEPSYPDSRALLDAHPNLVVMRTFSKAYGLAGLRVGYALAHPVVTDLLNRVRLSFNPNSVAQAAATAALTDTEHVARTVEMNRTERARVDAGLRKLGLTTIPSVCNFVTADVGKPGREVFQALLAEGVIVRPLDGYGMPNHLRISIGMPTENDRMLEALRKVLG
ncbi:MAG: histidinol-phosphate transaminase [Xanthomonadaceae bacterium]|nr:histidinol-phosphate transaminase [Xanthomonadaceae bacterium]